MKTTDSTLNLQTTFDNETPQPRPSLMRAFSQAEQVVSQLHAVPTDVDLRGSSVTGTYSVHLFFSRNGQAVLEFADRFDAEVLSSPSTYAAGVFLEATARCGGVDVKAWSMVDEAPDPDGPRERPADEDPTAYSLTPEAVELRSCCAGPQCTCTPTSPQDDEHVPPADNEVAE